MTVKDIISGKSEYLEFKREVPKKSEVYMKTVVAFANGSGGKLCLGWRIVHLRLLELIRKMLFL